MSIRNRPDRQWYARMIQETLDDDFVIGASVFPIDEQKTAASSLTVAFGVLVRLARRSRKLSVAQLAQKLSVDADEVQKIEHDPSYQARPRTISSIAKFLELPLKEVMTLAGAASSNDDAFRTQAMRFAAHSDDMSTLTPEEQELLRNFVRYLREKP